MSGNPFTPTVSAFEERQRHLSADAIEKMGFPFQPVSPQPQMWSSMHTNLFCADVDGELNRRAQAKAKWHKPSPIRSWPKPALLNLRRALR